MEAVRNEIIIQVLGRNLGWTRVSASQKSHEKIMVVLVKTENFLRFQWSFFDADMVFFFAPFYTKLQSMD